MESYRGRNGLQGIILDGDDDDYVKQDYGIGDVVDIFLRIAWHVLQITFP